MEIITIQDARLLAWAEAQLKATFDPSACRWVAGLDRGGVIWVVVYSRFCDRNCEVTIATDGSKRWATRRTLRAIFSHPFMQWGLARVTFIVAADNDRSLAMLRHEGPGGIGAKQEGRLRAAFDGDVDGIVFGLLKTECKWI